MNQRESALGLHYLETVAKNFRELRTLGERAISQLSNDSLFDKQLDRESNSIAILIRNLYGIMQSRWTGFLTTDGEKSTRDRDGEFELGLRLKKDQLMDLWAKGWDCLFAAISSLGPEDLQREVYIRKQKHTVIEAINRQLLHYAEHVGQIVFLAKHLESETWRSLSIPRGKSADYLQ